MQQLENDLDQTQEALLNANNHLEEKDKALSNVSTTTTTHVGDMTFYRTTYLIFNLKPVSSNSLQTAEHLGSFPPDIPRG